MYTDNNPLTYVLSTARLDATGHRWLAALASFDFDIKYRPGSCNADADVLSRLPGQRRQQSTGGSQHITSESVKAVCNSSQTESYVEGLAMSEQVITDTFHLQGQNLTGATDSELRRAQEEDPILSVWIKAVSSGSKPPMEALTSSPAHRTLQKSAKLLKMKKGKLYRETSINGEPCEQFVLPQKHIPDVLRQLHDNVGHMGRDRTLSLVRDRFYWPGMAKDADEWIKECPRCLRRKTPTNSRAHLVNIVTARPLELVCFDFLTLEKSKGGY